MVPQGCLRTAGSPMQPGGVSGRKRQQEVWLLLAVCATSRKPSATSSVVARLPGAAKGAWHPSVLGVAGSLGRRTVVIFVHQDINACCFLFVT